jgi:thymidylate synthase
MMNEEDNLWCNYSGMPSPMSYMRCDKCDEVQSECKCKEKTMNKEQQELLNEVYKNYQTEWLKENPPFSGPYDNVCLTKEQFTNKIKTDETFAEKWGELGPIYGKQWRNWESVDTSQYWQEDWSSKDTDQIQNLINELKTNPDSRRLMVSAWNVGELDKMVLPPCHYGFQLYTRKTTRDEKIVHPGKYRAISLMWNQRSVDTFLGLPFNIASYGLLLEIIAKEVNMIPDELIGNLGDVHLYKNHIEQAKEQISRTSFDLPTIQITERNWYQHQLVKERLGEKTLDEKLKSYRPDCFELIGYESHPKIKAPLSN